MKLRLLFITVYSLFIITCSNEDGDSLISSDIETKSYYGTYLYQDNDCSGSDIQYATINEEGIAFFDFLGTIVMTRLNVTKQQPMNFLKFQVIHYI